jgi:hypothetical protein
VRFVLAGVLRSRGRRGRYYSGRSQGKYNPENDVGQKTGSGKEHGEEPQDPDDRGIEVKIVGQAGADTGNLFICARAHESPLAARLGREAWRRSFRLLGAAVVAKLRTGGDVFLAANAGHWITPTERFYPAYLTINT